MARVYLWGGEGGTSLADSKTQRQACIINGNLKEVSNPA